MKYDYQSFAAIPETKQTSMNVEQHKRALIISNPGKDSLKNLGGGGRGVFQG
jgi:hypothetical protein